MTPPLLSQLTSSIMAFASRTFGIFAAALCVSASAQTAFEVSFTNSQGVRLTGVLYSTHWSGERPAVVLMHGCSGVFSSSIPLQGIASLYRDWAARLTNQGYVALLVDSFSGRGVMQDQCGNGSAGVSEVSDRPYDAYAALQYLNRSKRVAVDASRVFAMGWSQGGSSVMSALSSSFSSRKEGSFRGGFSFYPGCGLYNAFGGISTSTYTNYAPLTIFHGGIDPLYTVGYCQTRVDRAVAQGGPLQMLVYSGAQHSFDMATAITSRWTAYDVNAKASANAEVMNRLGQLSQ